MKQKHSKRRGASHHRAIRLLAGLALVVGLTSCGTDDGLFRYASKGDSRPHPGVERATRMPIQGIDISKWQGDIDWRAVKAAGTQFAFIKATEGGDHVDARFLANWNGAKAAGVARGAYHFVFWCRPAHEQVEWFRKHIPQDPDALPPVLDVEWNGHSKLCPRKIPREEALEKIRLMLTELEQHTGRRPIIYTDIPFHKEVLEGQFDDYHYWVRSTAAEPQERYPTRAWSFWQFTTTGQVPGIKGAVDRNAFYGTEKEWKAFLEPDKATGR